MASLNGPKWRLLGTSLLASALLAGCVASDASGTRGASVTSPEVTDPNCPDRRSEQEAGYVAEAPAQELRDRIAGSGIALDRLLETYPAENGAWVDQTGRIFINVTSTDEVPEQSLVDSLPVEVVIVRRAEGVEELSRRAQDFVSMIETVPELAQSEILVRWLPAEYCAEVVVDPPSQGDIDPIWSALEQVELPTGLGLNIEVNQEA